MLRGIAVEQGLQSEIKEHDRRPNNQHRPPTKFFSFFSTVKNETNSYTQAQERQSKPKSFIDVFTLIFVILTTIGVFWQACILNNTDHTFKETLAAQKKSSERQLRAYVIFTDAGMVLAPDHSMTANYTVKN